MGKKILSGNQIEVGLRVKLIKHFGNVESESEAIVIDFDLDDSNSITEIVLDWEKNGIIPYIVDDVEFNENIINFLEIID